MLSRHKFEQIIAYHYQFYLGDVPKNKFQINLEKAGPPGDQA